MADDFEADGTWLTLSTGAAIPAAVGPRPEDFRVDEVDAYPASGEGEHLLVRIEKRGLSTPEAVHRIAVATGLRDSEIGYAGRKDARALSTQRLSLPRRVEPLLARAEEGALRILDTAAHNRKLRMGHLAGNRFAINLSPIAAEQQQTVRARAQEIADGYLPNYFGHQRLGRGASNALAGLRLLAAGRSGRGRRNSDFLISAAQSLLFNDLVALRIRRDLFLRAVDGDLLKTRRGGLFTCTDAAADSDRIQRREVTITGPMYGRKMMTPSGTALTLESEILARRQMEAASFLSFKPPIPGTRRQIQVAVEDLTIEFSETATEIKFLLPAGSYATILVRELMRVTTE
ncbi:MAG: tRNA pseudouridine(13) synthase TruD [Deltaproteobacteria bacterium]|nr:tRNA pseudouridine(13) synthase TruD [Deltaproteobacteria bacterium]